jgi:hypothetical protein
VRTESPYLLTNQKLNQDIQIKAVDNSGNEITKTLEFKQYSIMKNIIYLIAIALIVLVLGWIILKNIKK